MATTDILEYLSHETPSPVVHIVDDAGDTDISTSRLKFPRIAPGSAPPKVLVVDDEPDVLNALRIRLKTWGFDVICAEDGMTATKIAIDQAPDVVLLDIGIPAGNGHTVAENLKQNLRTRYTPVIYLTARNAPQDRHIAEKNGAFDYITKPFVAADILATLNRALNIR
jgi:DNA-binding response OmpR family regulator